jgi:hypothetical protein
MKEKIIGEGRKKGEKKKAQGKKTMNFLSFYSM